MYIYIYVLHYLSTLDPKTQALDYLTKYTYMDECVHALQGGKEGKSAGKGSDKGEKGKGKPTGLLGCSLGFSGF